MFIPAWATLHPGYFLQRRARPPWPFPLNVPDAIYFYVARNAIYHLFRVLGLRNDEVVLVPDYHHGNEVRAIRAAGASLRFYPIRRNLQPDLDELARLSKANARVLFLIHYLGWPQPLEEITELCRRRGMILIEDCALSLLSEVGGRPLGTFGDYAIFCLYKTVPVPNGGVMVQNTNGSNALRGLRLRSCGVTSVAGNTAELVLGWVRSRFNGLGEALAAVKTTAGQALSTMRVNRVPVGDIGFNLENADLGMSSLSSRLLEKFDYQAIRQKRRENFLLLLSKLDGAATLLRRDLEEGACPLFFPILVRDKHAAARALWDRGIGVVEFWNCGDPETQGREFADAQFLREHVLELPIHQDVIPEQVEYMAEQVLSLKFLL